MSPTDKPAPDTKGASSPAPARSRVKRSAAADFHRRRTKGKDTRERILSAAAEEFARYGLEGGSIRSIASRAGVSHTRFVYYFDSKMGLWRAVVERACNDLINRYAGPLANADGVSDTEVLKRLYVQYIRFSAEDPHIGWIMSHSSREGGEAALWRTETFVAPTFKVVDELIRSSQAAGDHIPGDPSHLHLLFMGAASWIYLVRGETAALTSLNVDSEAFVEEHIRRCLSLFFPGHTGKTPSATLP